MISGSIKSPQDLVEVLSNVPKTKNGYLNVLSRTLFLSLEIKKNSVKGFHTNLDPGSVKYPESLLIYVLAEALSDTEGYFSFEESTAINDFYRVSIDLESLVIQATILRKELDEILPQIITTNVKLRSDEEKYNQKTLAEILVSSEDPISELRNLKMLLERERIGVYEIRKLESVEEIGLDYILEGVEYGKINLLKILESLKVSQFTGFVEIEDEGSFTYVFFKEGKIFGVHPARTEIFDAFLNMFGDLKASIIKVNDEFIDIFAQAFVGRPIISAEDKYISLGKLFLTLLTLKERGLVKIVKGDDVFIFIFRDGKLLSARRGKRWSENWSILFLSPARVYLYKDVYTENIHYLFYLFILNKILNILRKHSLEEELKLLIFKVAEIPSLYLEGSKVNPSLALSRKDEENLLKLLTEVTDRVIEKLGKERFESDLENELSPYRDVFRILDLSENLYKRAGSQETK
ncbi:MAG: hypothetical protein GXN96_05015 [Aquificae bacterium]|nr:hypothetical protein [Aquificota bacterium]